MFKDGERPTIDASLLRIWNDYGSYCKATGDDRSAHVCMTEATRLCESSEVINGTANLSADHVSICFEASRNVLQVSYMVTVVLWVGKGYFNSSIEVSLPYLYTVD